MAIKQVLYISLSALLFCACSKTGAPEDAAPKPDYAALEASCRYIQGGGANTTGGYGGTVYVVSTLADSINPDEDKAVPGTLRYAVEQGGARIVTFRVAGTIRLQKPLTITKGNITIAGQSAPGDGICLADYPLIIKDAENVIVRFIRVRMGEAGSNKANTEYDAVSVNNSKNVVLDHLSCSWSVDECVSCYGNTGFTMQYCIVSESLKNSVHGKGSHGYGGIWGGTNASFHHNLLAHHDSRNPRFDHDYVEGVHAGPIDFVNNVVYNWGGNSAYGGEGSTKAAGGRHINFVNNYFKPGPATKSGVATRLLNPTTKCGNCTSAHGGSVQPGKFYLAGNYMYGSAEVCNDNWKGVVPDEASKMEQCKASARWTDNLTDLTNEQSAEAAYETVLAKAGCSLSRDAIDTRIAREVKEGTYTYKGTSSTGGLIDTPSDVEGWPVYSGALAKDSDGDGIPDEWELANGMDPKSYGDSQKQTLVSGYTNLEVYLNAIVAHLY